MIVLFQKGRSRRISGHQYCTCTRSLRAAKRRVFKNALKHVHVIELSTHNNLARTNARSRSTQYSHAARGEKPVRQHSQGKRRSRTIVSTAQLIDTRITAQQNNTTQHSTAQHSTAQHSTAQHSTAQHQNKTGQEETDGIRKGERVASERENGEMNAKGRKWQCTTSLTAFPVEFHTRIACFQREVNAKCSMRRWARSTRRMLNNEQASRKRCVQGQKNKSYLM